MLVDVIGGSGFIGTRLCSFLIDEKSCVFSIVDKVFSKSHPDKVKVADVRSINTLQTAISDGAVIINLAAEHRDDVSPRSLYDEVNVDGARNVCTVARAGTPC